MAKKLRVRIESMSTRRGWSNESHGGEHRGEHWWTGEVVTPFGIVVTYRQSDVATLRFACDGRFFNMQIDGEIKWPALRARAFKFARDSVKVR